MLKVFCITSTSQPFRVTLIGSRVIEPMSSVKMISSPLLTLFLIISSFSIHFVASLPTSSDEYEYPNDAGDEYVYEDERSEEKYVAKELDVKITSEKKHVIVAEEDVIRLQCLVENNGESLILGRPHSFLRIYATGSGDKIRFRLSCIRTKYHFLSSF